MEQKMNGRCAEEICNGISINGHTTEKQFSTLDAYLRHVAGEVGMERSIYVMDLAEVLWRVQLWNENMPNIRPFYAVKTNSDRTLLRLLVTLGFSFDCASQGEIQLVLEAGGLPQNIIFAHPVKSPEALEHAKGVGVDHVTFDDEEELEKIQAHHPRAKLVLRLMPQNVKCSFDLSEKFGCPPDEAIKVLKRAKELQLDVIGISFHVGGLCRQPSSYVSTIRTCRSIFTAAQEELGFRFTLLDIGGGFRGAIGTEDAFLQASKEIQGVLKECDFSQEVEVIAEPGTYFISSAVILITGIIGTKTRKSKSQDPPVKKLYYINDSIYGSFFSGYHHYEITPTPLFKEGSSTERATHQCRIWGHTCCGDDLVLEEVLLPDLTPGEHLVWYNTGAYNHAICSAFCGMPIPNIKHIFVNRARFNFQNLTDKDVKNFILNTCETVGE